MKFGVFSKIFKDYPLEEAFKRIQELNISSIQFNFANVGLNSLPKNVSEKIIQEVKQAKSKFNISIPVISGTFNTLELNNDKHIQNIQNFRTVVEAASKLNIPFVSISTGSFNQEDFWSPHPDNHTQKGWDHLYQSLDEMLKIATDNGVTIVFEPEQANVVSTAEDALRLLKHYNMSPLKILYDAANIVTPSDINNLEGKIDTTLHQLSEHIAIAHCKDCVVTKDGIEFAPVGKGNLPLKHYISKLKTYYSGPVIMHGLEEKDIPFAINFLNN